MLSEKEKSLIMLLELPHRISNPRAMMQACEDAAAIIKRQDAVIEGLVGISKPKRARNSNGTLKADDPATPENEAWEGGKAPKKKAKKN